MGEIRCVAETRCLVGEGPLWHIDEQALYWTDINGMKVHRLQPDSGHEETWQFQQPVSALSLTNVAGWLLVAAGTEVLRWNPAHDERVLFATVEAASAGNRLNDGATDPDGNFWVGSMPNNVSADGSAIDVDWASPESRSGSLYRVSPDGSVTRQGTGFAIPNTMLWSPDHSTLYSGDSIDNSLYAYDYQRGAVSGRRTFTHGFDRGVPDGSAIDEQGFLWNCRFFGSCIVRFSPGGTVDRVVQMPVTNITNCAFGGPDLQTLYVTTASEGTTGEPLAGALFALEPGVTGLPSFEFRLQDQGS